MEGRETDRSIYRNIEKSIDRTDSRHIDISKYRYIEGTETQRQNRNRKKIINNIIKQYYAEDTAIWIFLVEYLGGSECYLVGNTGVLQEVPEPEE